MFDKKRNSSIELLKVFAIILIIINHCVQTVQIVNNIEGVASNILNLIILNILRISGQIGNVIFIICSSYYLLDSNKIKLNKLITIILDTFIISIIWLIPFLFINIPISTTDIIKQFAPITFKNNWFISCYIIIYLIHPLINIICDKLTKKEFFVFDLILFIIFSCMQSLVHNIFYFNELFGFIYIYFIVGYIKKYVKDFQKASKLNMTIVLIAMLLNIVILLCTNYMGLKIPVFSDKVLYWNNNLVNPCYLALGISLLNLFLNFNFYSKLLNYFYFTYFIIFYIYGYFICC